MMYALPRLMLTASLLAAAAAQQTPTGFPFQNESIHYNINWQSGLNLGEASFVAHRTATGWEFQASGDAPFPGFVILDKYHSSTDANLCSSEFERDLAHGGKKTREKTTFDQKKGEAHRTTLLPADGGKSTFDIPSCARDALAFIYYARRELGQGRVPPQQQIFFGSAYTVHLDYTGAQTIRVGDKPEITDHLVVSIKGPKSDFNFEVFYARDAARTPVSVRIPTGMGTFSMDVVR